MKNIYRVILFTLSISLITGCASYVSPTTGPIATIKTANPEATIGAYKNANECKGYASLPYHVFSGNIPTKVPAEKLATFKISANTADYACWPTVFSFVPKANHTYLIKYAPKKQKTMMEMFSMEKQHCTLTITNLTKNRKIKFYIRHYQSSILPGKSHCAPLTPRI